jgi:hypothetical protein
VRAQPSADRYFSIEPSRLVALTRDWPLRGCVGTEPRRFRNPQHIERAGQLLACLRPGRDVTVYSLPVNVDAVLGERAVTRALEALERWKAEPVEDVDGRSRSIVVYLHDGAQLRVLDERLKFARRKFGAGEGLSSSRKPRVTSRDITELARVTLD